MVVVVTEGNYSSKAAVIKSSCSGLGNDCPNALFPKSASYGSIRIANCWTYVQLYHDRVHFISRYYWVYEAEPEEKCYGMVCKVVVSVENLVVEYFQDGLSSTNSAMGSSIL